jgi:hypothetical protein
VLHPSFPSPIVVALAATLAAAGAAAAARGDFSLELYGDVAYAHYDHGPDQRTGDAGAPKDSRATVDVPYVVAELTYRFRPDLFAEIEVEFEHGGTGAELELEYEEFGEYETEVGKGGEVLLEQFHVTKTFAPPLSVRVGRFVTAVGLLNRSHLPTEFFTATRAEEETSLLPTTWNETGLEAYGRIGTLRYRVQLVNALDSTGFSSKHWVVGGHQGRFELVRATDVAAVARLDWTPASGLLVGGSAYRGNTTGNRPKPDMEGIDANLTIADVHGTFDAGPWRARALWLLGRLENADLVSAKNSRLSTNLGLPRTPVARGASAWYGEVGYDVASLLPGERGWRLYPFAHYGRYDTMAEVDAGVFADPRFEREVATAGVNLFPDESVVLKIDYSNRSFGTDRIRDEKTLRVDVGFAAELIGL